MDVLTTATLWWIACGIAIAVELATGTVYLLMVAAGLAAGAVAAHLALAGTVQVVAASIVGGLATMGWHWHRRRQPLGEAARADRGVNLDIGDAVHVAAWAADRTARVSHRGSVWEARLEPGVPAAPGPHRIVAVEGNWLVLAPPVGEAAGGGALSSSGPV